jgi:4'-phosphopantetheinyl transferase
MREPKVWTAAFGKPRLSNLDVHVWRAFLDCRPDLMRQFETTLSTDEKVRAERFHFSRDRDHFIAARGILRELLASYTHASPGELQFTYGAQKKPALLGNKMPATVKFNLSHSHGLAVFAISEQRELGIDLELVQPGFATDGIAERYFSSRELAELRALPPEQMAEGFFLCWTRKEAYVKAHGAGLHIPLDSFDVTLTPGEPERLRSTDSERWSLRSFKPASEFAGAMVVEGRSWQASYFEWSHENDPR